MFLIYTVYLGLEKLYPDELIDGQPAQEQIIF